MRRGFTLIEVMIASAIGAVVMTAVCGLFLGLFTMMRETAAELQVAIHARALRTKLLYQVTKDRGGLVSAKALSRYDSEYLLLKYPTGADQAISIANYELNTAADSDHAHTTTSPFMRVDGSGADGCIYVYLKAQKAGATYTDRILVPLFGQQLPDDEDHGGLTMNSDLFKGLLGEKAPK